jgi:hypothetical protein
MCWRRVAVESAHRMLFARSADPIRGDLGRLGSPPVSGRLLSEPASLLPISTRLADKPAYRTGGEGGGSWGRARGRGGTGKPQRWRSEGRTFAVNPPATVRDFNGYLSDLGADHPAVTP